VGVLIRRERWYASTACHCSWSKAMDSSFGARSVGFLPMLPIKRQSSVDAQRR
jgi:hypothetical protein